MSDVTIYTTRICAYCLAAKALLRSKGIAYEEIDVTADDAKRAWLLETTGQRTVPQIFIHGRSVGGFVEVAALERRGELEPMVRGEDI